VNERVLAVLCSPTFQGLAALLIGGLLVQANRIPGLEGELRSTLTAAATAALVFGAAKLAGVGTQKKVEEALINQERVEAKVDHARTELAVNSAITAEAADAAKVAVVHAEVAAAAASTAADEAAQSRRLP
jgi:hypothetical protein